MQRAGLGWQAFGFGFGYAMTCRAVLAVPAVLVTTHHVCHVCHVCLPLCATLQVIVVVGLVLGLRRDRPLLLAVGGYVLCVVVHSMLSVPQSMAQLSSGLVSDLSRVVSGVVGPGVLPWLACPIPSLSGIQPNGGL